MLRIKQFPRESIAAVVLAAVAACVIFAGPAHKQALTAHPEAAHLRPTGYPQLIATQSLPEIGGEICAVETASLQEPIARGASAGANRAPTRDADRSPLRIIHDTLSNVQRHWCGHQLERNISPRRESVWDQSI